MNKKDKYKEYEKILINNPFVNNNSFYIEVSVLEDQKSYTQHIDNNEPILLPKKYYFERQKSIKIYKSKQIKNIILNRLPTCAKDLFYYILFECQTNKDFIILNDSEYIKEFKISDKTFKRAIKSLTDFKIIERYQKSECYYINPLYFFSGSRIKNFPDKIKEYKPK